MWVSDGSGRVGKEQLESVTKHRKKIEVAQVELANVVHVGHILLAVPWKTTADIALTSRSSIGSVDG